MLGKQILRDMINLIPTHLAQLPGVPLSDEQTERPNSHCHASDQLTGASGTEFGECEVEIYCIHGYAAVALFSTSVSAREDSVKGFVNIFDERPFYQSLT